MKRKLFRNYWWLGPTAGVLVIGALWPVTTDRGPLVLSVLAALMSVAFFVQQQKLAELQLFKQLFVEFNQRYDKLNEPLQRILVSGLKSDQDRMAALDYFNLCAEEYLFFVEGYIDDRVWRAWSNGMRTYFECPAIGDLWRNEQKSNSYYGFQPPSGNDN